MHDVNWKRYADMKRKAENRDADYSRNRKRRKTAYQANGFLRGY